MRSLVLTSNCIKFVSAFLTLNQEAFEESNSEDDLDEDESCHSSSSDTLTCSIPEVDLEQMLSIL